MNNYHTGIQITSTGFVDSDDGHMEINMSEIYTALIHEAGRWCEDYASDILHSIDEVKRDMASHTEWQMKYYYFGFRKQGVDGRDYIKHEVDEGNRHYYRAIWELSLEKHDGYMVTATLKRKNEEQSPHLMMIY